MLKVKLHIVLSFMLIISYVSTMGQSLKDPKGVKVNIAFGTTISSIFGSELKNPTIKPGLVIGLDVRKGLGERFQLFSSLNVAYKGSKFNNTESDNYYKINLVYAELPVLTMIKVPSSERDMYVTFGLAASYLLQSEVFVKPKFIAFDKLNNLGFKKMDFSTLAGIHIDYYYFGWSLNAQVSLRNISDNLFFENILPVTGTGGTISNFAINTKIHF